MRREVLGLGPFLTSLERRLDELPAEQLRRVLLEHGARLPAGHGYDSDYGEYRAFGDETWTIEVDELLDRAGAAFLAGDVRLARGAYRVLLEAIGRDDQDGFPGAGTPEELISGNLAEASTATCARSGRASRRPPGWGRWWRPPTRSATSGVTPPWPRSTPPDASQCPTSTVRCPT